MNWGMETQGAKACWVARTIVLPGPCRGGLQRAHLVPRSLMKGTIGPTGVMCPVDRCGAASHRRCRDVRSGQEMKKPHAPRVAVWNSIAWDCRSWVWMCEAHHHALDFTRTLKIPRDALPAAVEEFAAEYGYTAWLAREYGPQEMAA